ncbi:MAG TPA: S41 family peptidase, partial [Casimicrobiaceae bacterium]|nr:S41 family peptidase [Casimicrobiaceae bacterium]
MKVPGKRDGWKKAGLIGLGTVLGVLLSLNFSAIAQREAKTPIPYEDLQLLSAVFGKIKSDYVETVPDDKLIKEAINGMVHGLDPHSDFLDAEAFKELQVSTQGKFGGLGIEVGVEDGVVRVTSPIEDTPAFRAGIKAGDLIVKIDDIATRGLPLSKAVEKMRGKPGTSVVLTVVRKDVDQPLVFTLVREEINVKSVRAKMLEPGYGYIRIRNFQERTGEDLAKALKDFYAKGDLKGLVLDVRSDPGGLLNQAVAVSAAFLPKDALVVYTDGRTPDARMRLSANKDNYSRRGDDIFKDLPTAVKKVPMVVLVDGGTASASEIVAGALQDHKRAVVMGNQTFGKGSVQTILPLGNNAGLKLTTA